MELQLERNKVLSWQWRKVLNYEHSSSDKLLIASLYLMLIEEISFLVGVHYSKCRDIPGRIEDAKRVCFQHRSWLVFVNVDSHNEGFEISLVKSIKYAVFLNGNQC